MENCKKINLINLQFLFNIFYVGFNNNLNGTYYHDLANLAKNKIIYNKNIIKTFLQKLKSKSIETSINININIICCNNTINIYKLNNDTKETNTKINKFLLDNINDIKLYLDRVLFYLNKTTKYNYNNNSKYYNFFNLINIFDFKRDYQIINQTININIDISNLIENNNVRYFTSFNEIKNTINKHFKSLSEKIGALDLPYNHNNGIKYITYVLFELSDNLYVLIDKFYFLTHNINDAKLCFNTIDKIKFELLINSLTLDICKNRNRINRNRIFKKYECNITDKYKQKRLFVSF